MDRERITEAELSESEPFGWDATWRSIVERDRGPAFTAEARFGLRLLAEVRRLRGLIVEGDSDGALRQALEHGQPWAQSWRGVLAEARAIREEQEPPSLGPITPTLKGLAGVPAVESTVVDNTDAPVYGEPRLTFNEEAMGEITRVWVNGRPFVPEEQP